MYAQIGFVWNTKLPHELSLCIQVTAVLWLQASMQWCKYRLHSEVEAVQVLVHQQL